MAEFVTLSPTGLQTAGAAANQILTDFASPTAAQAGHVPLVNAAGSGYVAHPLGEGNLLLNGNFDLWQRGVSITGDGPYGPDQWVLGLNLSGVQTRTTTIPTVASLYSLHTRPSANGSALSWFERQRFERSWVRRTAGKPLVVSFWYSSSIAGTHYVRFANNLGAGVTGGMDLTVPFTVATTNAYILYTVQLGTASLSSAGSSADHTEAGFLDIGPVTSGQPAKTVTTTDYIFLADVWLEFGTVPRRRERRPLALELALCQRYYEKSYALDVVPGTAGIAADSPGGHSKTGSEFYAPHSLIAFQVRKRAAPAVNIYSPNTGAGGAVYPASGGADVTNVSAVAINPRSAALLANSGTMTVGLFHQFYWTADASL